MKINLDIVDDHEAGFHEEPHPECPRCADAAIGIRPPRQIFSGFDWSRTDKLKPTGDAERANVLAERLQPPTPLRGDHDV